MDGFSSDEWIALDGLPGVGPAIWGALMRGELDAPHVARLREALAAPAPMRRARAHRSRAEAAGAEPLTPADPRWPETLRVLPDPPAVLWVRGNPAVLAAPQLAVVGARRASRRALADTAWLVPQLVEAGLVVTSGLALGIDGAAHVAALDAGGRTIAVLGHGIDSVHPARHRMLAARIPDAGALASEFAPGTPWHRTGSRAATA